MRTAAAAHSSTSPSQERRKSWSMETERGRKPKWIHRMRKEKKTTTKEESDTNKLKAAAKEEDFWRWSSQVKSCGVAPTLRKNQANNVWYMLRVQVEKEEVER